MSDASIPTPRDPTLQEQLSELFGGYRAEWLKGHLFDLFWTPQYFHALTTARPCFLVGGRGTGKTTVLRGLSYEGQLALSKNNTASIRGWPYYGIYYRVDTNRVAAFKGAGLSEEKWVAIFGHYMNLLLCDQTMQFLEWYQLYTGTPTELSARACRKVSLSFGLDPSGTNADLAEQIELARIEFEAFINNVADGGGPQLSLQGAALDTLFDAIAKIPEFKDKRFFFLIDEYENLHDYQQQVFNTLIKHSGELYTFKIGVKELGWRRRTTLNENEQLISPADYAVINIAEELEGDRFKDFAFAVCQERLTRVRLPNGRSLPDIKGMLPGITEDQEAERLGIQEINSAIKKKLLAEKAVTQTASLDGIEPLRLYMIAFWAKGKNQPISETYRDYLANAEQWETRYGNYKHALLYTIRRGKRGIRKYYCGWDTFTQVAGGNIRYLLQLVVESLLLQLEDDNELRHPVTPEVQTKAAQKVGHGYVGELQGLTVHGAALTKLVLSLGRVFGVMAAEAEGHAPEVNQFQLTETTSEKADRLSGVGALPEKVERLLSSAVMHLALIRFAGSKPGDKGDIRDFDYMVHPVFSPFFGFSYRRKRKMNLSSAQLLGLVDDHRMTIPRVLQAAGREKEDTLPEQLSLFGGFYDDIVGT